jgi:hypothetical protein
MKKIGFLTVLMMSLVLFALAFPVGAAAPAPPHPHIHEGLEAMRSAKHHLESADHDFHGHRVKAIEHLDQAIHEAEICEQEP